MNSMIVELFSLLSDFYLNPDEKNNESNTENLDFMVV